MQKVNVNQMHFFTFRERSTLKRNKCYLTTMVAISVLMRFIHASMVYWNFLGSLTLLPDSLKQKLTRFWLVKTLGKWSSERHFRKKKIYKGSLDDRCICDLWYRHGHFVNFVLCLDYYTFLDPLTDESVIEHIVHENVKNIIKQSYDLKGMEVPKIPTYK